MTQQSRVLLAVLIGVAAYAYAQKLDLRTGQWAFTMSGLPGLPGDTSKLPPQVRAQIEAKLAQPQTYESCLTAADVEALNFGDPEDDDECEVTSRKVVGNGMDMTRVCKNDDGERTETIHVEAVSSESMKATINIKSEKGQASSTITGKWIGATCKDGD